MSDKLKKILYFVVSPIVLLLSIVSYLYKTNQRLRSEANRREAENQLGKELDNLAERKSDANQAENDYKSTRDKYLSEHDDKG